MSIPQYIRQAQALRVINTTCKHVTVQRGNTRGNTKPYDELDINQPIPKRPRKIQK